MPCSLGGLGGTIPALEDAALATELARARNTWVAEYCSENPARLKGTAVLPQQDTAAAVAELRRTVTELGFVGVSLLPNLRGRHIGDPYFFPLYEEAERLNIPICVHMFLGRYGSEATGTMRVDKFFYSHLFGHTFEQMIALAVVLGEGLLDRFPKLRFVFLESGAGWLPYWFYRLDEHYEVLGNQVPELKTMPSKLLERGQLYFSCEADETEIPASSKPSEMTGLSSPRTIVTSTPGFPVRQHPSLRTNKSATHPSARFSMTTRGGSIRWVSRNNLCHETADTLGDLESRLSSRCCLSIMRAPRTSRSVFPRSP